jgi:GxxExxY protein
MSKPDLPENVIARKTVDVALRIHRRLGPGLLESAYEIVLAHELRKAGLRCARQVAVPMTWDGLRVDLAFRADLIVDDAVLVELKATEAQHPAFVQQALTRIKLLDLRLGLVLNFGTPLLKDGIQRVVNGL